MVEVAAGTEPVSTPRCLDDVPAFGGGKVRSSLIEAEVLDMANLITGILQRSLFLVGLVTGDEAVGGRERGKLHEAFVRTGEPETAIAAGHHAANKVVARMLLHAHGEGRFHGMRAHREHTVPIGRPADLVAADGAALHDGVHLSGCDRPCIERTPTALHMARSGGAGCKGMHAPLGAQIEGAILVGHRAMQLQLAERVTEGSATMITLLLRVVPNPPVAYYANTAIGPPEERVDMFVCRSVG